MVQNELRKTFYESINNFVDTDTNILIQNGKANQNGVLQFNEIIPIITELKEALKLLTLDIINELPESRFGKLQQIGNVVTAISAIQNITKNSSIADAQQKAQTINSIYNLWNQVKEFAWNIVVEALTLYNYQQQSNTESENKLKELNETIKAAKKSNDDFNLSIGSYKKEFEAVINSVKIELSKGGVGKHADIFNSQSKHHEEKASTWRLWFIGLIMLNFADIITILCIILFKDALTQNDRIELGVFGVALASLISYAIVICVKNYYAEKHNQTVNQHKANCLGTFNTFVDAADPDKKGAILLQASQTIFSHQKSGYLSKDSDVSSPSPVIEILSKMAK